MANLRPHIWYLYHKNMPSSTAFRKVIFSTSISRNIKMCCNIHHNPRILSHFYKFPNETPSPKKHIIKFCSRLQRYDNISSFVAGKMLRVSYLLLYVVIRKCATILQFFDSNYKSLLIRRDTFLVLGFSLYIFNGIRSFQS